MDDNKCSKTLRDGVFPWSRPNQLVIVYSHSNLIKFSDTEGETESERRGEENEIPFVQDTSQGVQFLDSKIGCRSFFGFGRLCPLRPSSKRSRSTRNSTDVEVECELNGTLYGNRSWWVDLVRDEGLGVFITLYLKTTNSTM